MWCEDDDNFEREFIITNGVEESSHILNNEYEWELNWADFGELTNKSLKDVYVQPRLDEFHAKQKAEHLEFLAKHPDDKERPTIYIYI